MNESRKEKIQALEEELLHFEAEFSSGKSVDVAEILLKTKQLTFLTEEQAFQEGLEEGITEGMKAGLVLQSVKKRQAQKEHQVPEREKKQDVVSLLKNKESLKEGIELAKEHLKQGVGGTFVSGKEKSETQGEEKVEKTTTREEEFPWEETVYHQNVSTGKEEKPHRDWSELNLGKYIMGILAAVLALTGTALLGALSWQYLSDPVKALILGSVGSVMVALPTWYIHQKGEEVKNGFLTSVMGAGLSILYMNILFLGIWWKLIGETPMLLGLIALIFLTAYLAHHIHSNTLLVVSYLGNIGTFLLLFSKVLTLMQLYIAIPSLLITAVLLMGYTLKSDWTATLTKGCSLLLGGIVMVCSTGNVVSNYHYVRVSTENAPQFYQIDSPFFWIYGICFLFAFGMGLLLGCAGSQLEEFDLYQGEVGGKDKGAFIHGGLLLLAYFMFVELFLYIPEWFLFLVASTFFLNKAKVVPALVSIPFVFEGLDELVWSRIHTIFQFTTLDSRYFVLYLVMISAVLVLFFFTEEENTVARVLVKWAYGWGAIYPFLACGFGGMNLLSHVMFLPLLLCCGLYFYRGLKKSQEDLGGMDSLWDLIYYIPATLLIGNQIERTMSGSFSVVPSVVLIMVALLKLGEKLIPPMETLTYSLYYKLTLEAFQIMGYIGIGGQLTSRNEPTAIVPWMLTALLLVLVESFYHLIKGEFTHSVFKFKYMLSIPLAINSLSQLTYLGDLAVTSSVILICSGSLSIFFGFRHTDENLRQLGLAMSILSVLKMVIVDVSSSDSITRVLAMIFGAVLCFGISHVYNKLE